MSEEEVGVSPGGGGDLAGQHQVGDVGLHTTQLLASWLFRSSVLFEAWNLPKPLERKDYVD